MSPFVATYRLQLGPTFTFADAREQVPYLRDLGVSHLYLSPVMQARSGSTHGYDVVDPTTVSRDLGGEGELRALAAAGLDVVVDIVPNHMAVSDENRFWSDPVLRAQFFDLDPAGGHRRFFDVDDLAGVRMEDPEVFAVTHAKLFELVADGVVAAVRVDHIDGLADPAQYLERLRAAGVAVVWVEKILEPGEQLRPWPIAGTTGYEFLVDADALFVDPDGRAVLDELAGLRGNPGAFAALAAAAKLQQAATTFTPEVERLRRIADIPGLETALAVLPIYRTYIDAQSGACTQADHDALAPLPQPVVDALLRRTAVPDEFVTRFQQSTGAIMAKGVEDTAMYQHVRLLALNEVGGQPDRFSLSIADFHAANGYRQSHWPDNLLAATTHDTKRTADVRARIGALAELRDEWRELVVEWRALLSELGTGSAPDGVEQLFVLQTLVGAWPISMDRLDPYLVKALREGKRNSSWITPNESWERAVIGATAALCADARFLETFLPFLERVRSVGERSSLGQTVLRLTSPGIPDIYQGDDDWTFSLVDPDNRRPVDWELRHRTTAALRAGTAPDRATAKQFTVAALLALRARHGAFAGAAYVPLDTAPSVCAYARGHDVVVAVPTRSDIEVPNAERLGLSGKWTDLLDPLAAPYGSRRPAVFERI